MEGFLFFQLPAPIMGSQDWTVLDSSQEFNGDGATNVSESGVSCEGPSVIFNSFKDHVYFHNVKHHEHKIYRKTSDVKRARVHVHVHHHHHHHLDDDCSDDEGNQCLEKMQSAAEELAEGVVSDSGVSGGSPPAAVEQGNEAQRLVENI